MNGLEVDDDHDHDDDEYMDIFFICNVDQAIREKSELRVFFLVISSHSNAIPGKIRK